MRQCDDLVPAGRLAAMDLLTEVNGLPTHVLLVHAVVLFVPLTALLVTGSVLAPRARRWLGILPVAVAFGTLLLVPLTTHAGEWLRDRVPQSPLVQRHAEMGDGLLPWALGLFVLAAASWLFFRRVRPNALLRVAFGLLAVALSVGAVAQVYRIGDTGARAAWQGRFSDQARGVPR